MADDSVDEGLEGPTAEQDLSCDCAALVDLHEECCTLQYIIDSGYWVLPGDRVALADGRVGEVRGFLHILEGEAGAAEDESYAVAVDGVEETVQCAPAELRSLAADAETAAAAAEAATAAAAATLGGGGSGGALSLTVARVLPHFCAGTLFSGDIAIPGDAGFASAEAGARQDYLLYVLGRAPPDALGNTRLCARHEAYGDEQSCDVTLRDVGGAGSGGGVAIAWRDNETFCEGRLHVDLAPDGAFGVGVAGEVKQLVQAQEGFWEPADEVTHTFRLGVILPEAEAAEAAEAGGAAAGGAAAGGSEVARRGLARARARLGGRQRARLEACTALAPGLQSALMNPAVAMGDGPGAPLTVAARASLRVRFPDLVLSATRAAEEECAAMRHHARVLDAVAHEDAAAKAATLAALAAGGLTRGALHQRMDDVVAALRAVLLLARLARVGASRDMVDGMQNGHYRMMMNYERVDKSLGCAEKRLPQALVRGWRLPMGAAEADEACAICMTTLAEGDDDADGDGVDDARPHFLKLPCGHAFHEECVQGWLNQNPTCPNCRRDLGGGGDATAPPPPPPPPAGAAATAGGKAGGTQT